MAVIEKIQINNFRNINKQLIKFNKNINLFIADNAQGKTNLIEAIYYLSHNKSFKSAKFKDIVKNQQNKLQIIALTDNNKITLTKTNNNTNLTINNNKINNISTVNKLLPIQLISPDKGFIVGSDPKNKRHCLDWGVFHMKPSFIELHKNYQKTLKNINILLATNDKKQLLLWFEKIAIYAVNINNMREEYLLQLKKITVHNYCKNIDLNIKNFNYKFNNGWGKNINNTQDSIYRYLASNINTIIKHKYLKIGSHLANIHFYYNRVDENNLSRGEQKTLSIIFLLTQTLYLMKNNIKPIILVDDINSEIDNTKLAVIIEFIQKTKLQTFITSINNININNCNIYKIKCGEIELLQCKK